MKNKIRKILAVIMTAVMIAGVVPTKALANTNYDSVREAIQYEIDFLAWLLGTEITDERIDKRGIAFTPIITNAVFGIYTPDEMEEGIRIAGNRIDLYFMVRPEINYISRISVLYTLVSSNISNNSINASVVGYLSEILYLLSLPYADPRFKDFFAIDLELIKIRNLIQDPVEDEPIDEDPAPSYDINAIRHWVALALEEIRISESVMDITPHGHRANTSSTIIELVADYIITGLPSSAVNAINPTVFNRIVNEYWWHWDSYSAAVEYLENLVVALESLLTYGYNDLYISFYIRDWNPITWEDWDIYMSINGTANVLNRINELIIMYYHAGRARDYIELAAIEFLGFIPTYYNHYLFNPENEAELQWLGILVDNREMVYVYGRLTYTEAGYLFLELVIDHGLRMEDAFQLAWEVIWNSFVPVNWYELDTWVLYLQPRRELYSHLVTTHGMPSDMALWLASESVQNNIHYTETGTWYYFINYYS